ncbi:MAG: PAS domain S-box protein [Anaerolineae bacterium]
MARVWAVELERLGLTDSLPTQEQWALLLERLKAVDNAPLVPVPPVGTGADHDIHFLEAAVDAVIIFDPVDAIILAANAQAAALYGFSAEEMTGLSLAEISSSRENARRRIDDLMSGSAEGPDGWYHFEAVQRRKDNSPLVVSIQCRRTQVQGRAAILSINRDVTELQRVQRALATYEERFARIFDTGPVAAAVLDADGHILDANDAMLAMLERTTSQLVGHHLSDLRIFDEVHDQLIQTLPTPPVRSAPIRLIGEQGSERHALASAEWIELGGERNLLVQFVDITEQKRVEAELRASEVRYRRMLIEVERQARETALLDQVRTMMAREENLGAVLRAVVQGIRDYFGYDLVSLYLVEDEQLVLQHQVGYSQAIGRIPLAKGVMARSIRSGDPVLLPDVREDPDFLGAISGIRSEICVPLFVGDVAAGVLNVETMDETLDTHDLDLFLALAAHISLAIQRARLVSELQLSNERYDALLRSVQEVIFQTDADGCWLYLNPAWERLSGYPVFSMIGRNWVEVVHPDDRLKLGLTFTRLIRRHETYYQFYARFMTATGDERWCEISGRINYTDDGVLRGATGTASDITERYKAELREREQRQLAESLVENAALVASANTADEVIRSALENIRQVISHFDALRVALVEQGMAHMVTVAAPGQGELGNGHHVWELQASQLPLVGQQDLLSARLFSAIAPESLRLPGLEWVRSAIVAPLRSKESLLGYLYLDSHKPHGFTETEAQWVQGFAGQMGTALHNLRLRADMAGYAQELELRVDERTDQYRQAKEQVETILNTSPEAIALVSTAGHILQVNQTFRATFGAFDTQTSRPQLASFLTPDSVPLLRSGLAACMQGTPQRLKLTAVRAGGSTFPAEAAIAPLVGDREVVHTAVCSLHDITEHQMLEDSLRTALDQERRLVDLKSRFGIMVSHEFRTPLATIQTSTDLLVNYGDRLSQQRRVEALENIARQVRHLTTMLDDILAISKADTVGMEFMATPTDLAELCHSIAEEVRWLDRNHHTVVYSAEGIAPVLSIDRGLLQRALINLLTNAVKYSPEGSTIEFRVRQIGDEITLVVRDEGIGIPESDIPRLFDTFFRASNVGIIPGTGLGLAIAQRAVEAHGGQIEVESRSGAGATFTIHLHAVLPS